MSKYNEEIECEEYYLTDLDDLDCDVVDVDEPPLFEGESPEGMWDYSWWELYSSHNEQDDDDDLQPRDIRETY